MTTTPTKKLSKSQLQEYIRNLVSEQISEQRQTPPPDVATPILNNPRVLKAIAHSYIDAFLMQTDSEEDRTKRFKKFAAVLTKAGLQKMAQRVEHVTQILSFLNLAMSRILGDLSKY